MYMYMYVYMYICVCVYIYIYMRVHTHVYTGAEGYGKTYRCWHVLLGSVEVCSCTYVFMNECMYVCMYLQMLARAVEVCSCIYVCTYV